MPARASRVVLLGLDGGTMTALGPIFERGWAPNLAALWRQSATGGLRSSVPMVTPVAWTSFATGSDPPRHGIHDFDYLEPSDRTIRHNHSGRVRVPHLWQWLGRAGRSVISLGLPMTDPAPPGARGLIVAGADAVDRATAFAQCPDFGARLRGLVPDYDHKILWKSRPRRLEDLRAQTRQTIARFRAQADAAAHADALAPDWSALLVHFHNLDSLQHRLWPYLDLDDSAASEPDWTAEVAASIRALDEAAGRLIDLAIARDAAIVAVSDHGFGPCRALVDVNGLLRRAGLQRGLPYGTRIGYRLQRLNDRWRRWRARRDGRRRRTPRSVAGQFACDWKRTIAFAPFGQLGGSIFLHPDHADHASRADRTISEIIQTFRDARDPANGARLFADAFSVADRYGLDPRAEGLPEVLAPSADGYQAQAKWDPFCRSWIVPDPNLPATHWRDGVLAIHAPDVRPGHHLDADLRDLAPTLLAMLDLPVPEAMQGRVLYEAFEEPLAGEFGARKIGTEASTITQDA